MQNLVNQNLSSIQHEVANCKHSNTNQFWTVNTKLFEPAPKDLTIRIMNNMLNPVTGEFTRVMRNVQCTNPIIQLPFITCDADEPANESTVVQQFDNASTKTYRYQLVGTINHSGDAHRGHYINNIRDQDQWVQTNNTTVTRHNDSLKLSTNLVGCWYTLIN